MKTIKELHEKYGIPYVERPTTVRLPNAPLEPWDPHREARPEIMEAAMKVMATHEKVLRALAKR